MRRLENSTKKFLLYLLAAAWSFSSYAQSAYTPKFSQSKLYSGIEVGSKGVKFSLLEIGKNAQRETRFTILKDSSINTDFISFSDASFIATLDALAGLYNYAINEKGVPPSSVYTVISSGVKVQAEKAKKAEWPLRLIDSFRLLVHDNTRKVDIIDALTEARLSHLGIVPDERRFNTFLIDIGSGNTKGGYFPNGNTRDFKLFELTWGTKSVANATEKRVGDDKTLENFNRNLARVLAGQVADEIVYAVNVSNAYAMNDYIAFSGGAAWATATLMFPELADNPVVPVTYEELLKFRDKLANDFAAVSAVSLSGMVSDADDRNKVQSEVQRVHKVFDQRSLLAASGLLQNIMRQFEGIYERKQFYLVKNGQVGWISAYVNQDIMTK